MWRGRFSKEAWRKDAAELTEEADFRRWEVWSAKEESRGGCLAAEEWGRKSYVGRGARKRTARLSAVRFQATTLGGSKAAVGHRHCRWCGDDEETEIHVIGECWRFQEERRKMTKDTEAEGLEGEELALFMMRGGERDNTKLAIWDRAMDFLEAVDNAMSVTGETGLAGPIDISDISTDEALSVLREWVTEQKRRE
jgi:hypothetical protein